MTNHYYDRNNMSERRDWESQPIEPQPQEPAHEYDPIRHAQIPTVETGERRWIKEAEGRFGSMAGSDWMDPRDHMDEIVANTLGGLPAPETEQEAGPMPSNTLPTT